MCRLAPLLVVVWLLVLFPAEKSLEEVPQLALTVVE